MDRAAAAQPARQRVQIHAERGGHVVVRVSESDGWARIEVATPASAWRPTCCRTCSSASTAPIRRASPAAGRRRGVEPRQVDRRPASRHGVGLERAGPRIRASPSTLKNFNLRFIAPIRFTRCNGAHRAITRGDPGGKTTMRILKAAAFVAALSILPVGAYAQSAPADEDGRPRRPRSLGGDPHHGRHGEIVDRLRRS